MAGRGEGAGIADGQEYRRCRLDADSWHGHQDDGKRRVIQEFLDLSGNDGTLVFELFDLRSDARDNQFNRVGADHGNRLFPEGGEDFIDDFGGVLTFMPMPRVNSAWTRRDP